DVRRAACGQHVLLERERAAVGNHAADARAWKQRIVQAEQTPRGSIEVHDLLVIVERDYSVGRGSENPREPHLAALRLDGLAQHLARRGLELTIRRGELVRLNLKLQ